VDARLVAVGDADLAVCDWGSGDPILFLQTALTADELVPLANQPALAGFRKLLYHWRGYGGSGGVEPSGSITSDAEDAWLLLTSMGFRVPTSSVSPTAAPLGCSWRRPRRSGCRAWWCPSHHRCTPRSGRSFVPPTSGFFAFGTIAV
jgi:hypothetical protein